MFLNFTYKKTGDSLSNGQQFRYLFFSQNIISMCFVTIHFLSKNSIIYNMVLRIASECYWLISWQTSVHHKIPN
ncbi:hypothetical protein EGW69_13375 [Enterococcus faecium]|nr:hypothetical protein EGW10_13170 [Enterococcus faecium]ROX59798.1 hypothetical protein EGW32_13160 [Enterococcus faecium]ROY70826.1 hypothetical protein EGW87_13370 [Enterococcus faecium]ROY77713.1 hypothetical protein EGW71_13545 [Enterococcus faecium]ROY77743.1 hypothetical protein EGW72_13545 [Enterococcus faecium]